MTRDESLMGSQKGTNNNEEEERGDNVLGHMVIIFSRAHEQKETPSGGEKRTLRVS